MDNSRSVEVGGCPLGNRWVVPYKFSRSARGGYQSNPWLECCQKDNAIYFAYRHFTKYPNLGRDLGGASGNRH